MDMGPPLCNPMLLHEIGKGKARLVLEASAALCSQLLDHESPPVFAHGVAVCHAGDIAGYLVSCHRSSVGLRWPSKRIAALHRLPIRSVLAARCALRCAPMAARSLRHLIREATLARLPDGVVVAGLVVGRRPGGGGGGVVLWWGVGGGGGGGGGLGEEGETARHYGAVFRLPPSSLRVHPSKSLSAMRCLTSARVGGAQPARCTHRLALTSACCSTARRSGSSIGASGLGTARSSKAAISPAKNQSPAPTVSTTSSGLRSRAWQAPPPRCSSIAPRAPSVSASHCAGVDCSSCCARP